MVIHGWMQVWVWQETAIVLVGHHLIVVASIVVLALEVHAVHATACELDMQGLAFKNHVSVEVEAAAIVQTIERSCDGLASLFVLNSFLVCLYPADITVHFRIDVLINDYGLDSFRLVLDRSVLHITIGAKRERKHQSLLDYAIVNDVRSLVLSVVRWQVASRAKGNDTCRKLLTAL